MKLAGRSLVAAMCVGQLGNLLPHVAVPAVMPQHLMPVWGLSGAEAGMMASAFAFGYMFAVPLLTTLTDRIDARNILLVGSIATALATLAFGHFANGLWSATPRCSRRAAHNLGTLHFPLARLPLASIAKLEVPTFVTLQLISAFGGK